MSQATSFRRFRIFSVGMIAALLGLAACSSPSPLSRIDSNRAVYESWPIDVQEAVYRGQAIPGMTPQQVEMAMGKPTSIDSRTGKDGAAEDIWVYKKSSARMPSILENTTIGVGTSVGGVGVGSSMPVGRGRSRPVDDESQEIIFKNGVVTRRSS